MPSRWNLPSVLLADAISRSPCRTWISTEGLLVDAGREHLALRRWDRRVRSISLVLTPRGPRPSDSGVTSSRKDVLDLALSTPAWMAEPTATTSSGLMPACGSFPLVSFLTSSWMAGIRVAPPTRITSFSSPGLAGILEGGMEGSTQRSVGRR